MVRKPQQRKPDVTDLGFILRRVFKKESFRALQEDVVHAVIDGHDVFLCAATSFGKSLCYQLPAVVSTGVTVVISPLLALMENQVFAAKQLDIAVECINSKTSWAEKQRIETDLLCGHPETKLLYVTPELCSTDHFRRLILKIHRQGQLTRIAIDEAHCISEWGHDFRPAYKDLVWLKTNLNCPKVPIIAVTATATKQVRDDIFKFLHLDYATTKSFSTSTARPNIHYEIQYFSESNPENGMDDVFPYLVARLKFMHQRRATRQRQLQQQQSDKSCIALPPITGIIYVPLRAAADHLALKLSTAGIHAQAYHAGLDTDQRTKVQASFLRLANTNQSDLRTSTSTTIDMESLKASFNIICATTAFGMGIDVPNIRFVIHYGLPRGMEAFTQESGRAGRDGKAASSLILYTREEKDRCDYRTRMDANKEKNKTKAKSRLQSLKSVVDFCEGTTVCRHALVAKYFGDDPASVDCLFACDVCKEGPGELKKRKDKGLATEEEAFSFTQREAITNYDYD
ncbi:hypothetical protein PV10_05344 [Exophiala mesophila]|uniref:ATP-dependent DNA helicase n=1 Tax=Exophiala mesophila TaxID=212818 RepID=A0A0D1ZV62_EXOME|nr:uncharacterized protein PV10_05344 [Exophiala mesophila]KIV90718.1 hypothetical protein PV10_05344 [Exophiala mesophila]